MTGREYLRRLQEKEATVSQAESLQEPQERRLARFREERGVATRWRRRAAGFVVFGLVGVCVGVLTGVLFTEWLIQTWPDRLPLFRPRSSVVEPAMPAAGPQAAEAVAVPSRAKVPVMAPAAGTIATSPEAEQRGVENRSRKQARVEVMESSVRTARNPTADSGPTKKPADVPAVALRTLPMKPDGDVTARAESEIGHRPESMPSSAAAPNTAEETPAPMAPPAPTSPGAAPVTASSAVDTAEPASSASPRTTEISPPPMTSADGAQQTAPVPTEMTPPEPPGRARSVTKAVFERLKEAATLTPAETEALDRVKSVLGHLPEVRLGKALVGWAKRVASRPLAHDVPAPEAEAEN